MTNLQPVLVPCKGVLADLHVLQDSNNPDYLQVFWGTALLQVIPRDKNSLIFRIVVGLLARLKFKMGMLCKSFGVSEKTVREWRDALNSGEWNRLSEVFHGTGAPRKLGPDIVAYIRGRYRKAIKEGNDKTPYGFRKELLEEVACFWGMKTNEETLRLLFRDEDQQLQATAEIVLGRNKSEKEEVISVEPENDVDGGTFSKKTVPLSMSTKGIARREESCAIEENSVLLSDKTDNILPVFRKREVNSPVLPPEHPTCQPAIYEAKRAAGQREEPCVIEGNSTSPSDETNNIPPVFREREVNSSVSPPKHPTCEPAIAKASRTTGSGEEPCVIEVNGPSLANTKNDISPNGGTAIEPNSSSVGRSFPLLCGKASPSPFISQHAGLLILSPWFEQAFGHHPAIIQQTAAQILAGSVIPEQSKLIDYDGLEALIGKTIHNIYHQHTRLEQYTALDDVLAVYSGNAALMNLQNQKVFYCDPHHEKYTGIEDILESWSGLERCVCQGIILDFIHTEWGSPCFIGHFDNFYDCRQRFLIARARFLTLFKTEDGGFVWIHDRGFWGIDFLHQIADLEDYFIQWEKGYEKEDWAEEFIADGKFAMTRCRNTKKDRRKYRFLWREQEWDKISDGRRLIVRARHPNGRKVEVAIVTNHPTMSAERIIRLMFNRWVQEGDFSYLNRHYGLHQLSGRLFERYSELVDELEDRQVESRTYKANKAERKFLSEKLGRQLVKLRDMKEISLNQLDAEREEIRRKSRELSQKLKAIDPEEECPDKLIDLLRREIRCLKGFLIGNKKKYKAEERRQLKVKEVEKLSCELDVAKAKLSKLSKEESRILCFIEEGKVRPDMRKKALLDGLRITSRNVFHSAFDIFRPIYNNRRDDHVVFRALTRSGGIIVPHNNRIDIYLTPRLQREPAEWARIRQFLDICEHRIAKQFPTPVRILTQKRSGEILYAATRREGNFK